MTIPNSNVRDMREGKGSPRTESQKNDHISSTTCIDSILRIMEQSAPQGRLNDAAQPVLCDPHLYCVRQFIRGKVHHFAVYLSWEQV
jgi:hypothetical protein